MSFVLVHGAFRGGWAWTRVRALLQAEGHDVHTPSLTGMGDRAHLRPSPLGLDVWVDDVASLLVTHDLTDVVLAGHSQGAIVLAALAARSVVGERIRHVVYLDAPVPQPGERGVDLNGPLPGDVTLPEPDVWLAPSPLDGSCGLDADDIDWVNARLCHTPVGPSLDVIVPLDAPPVDIPATYVFCDRTPAHFPSVATRRRFDESGVAYLSWDAPHDVALTDPARVVELLTTRRAAGPVAPSR